MPANPHEFFRLAHGLLGADLEHAHLDAGRVRLGLDARLARLLRGEPGARRSRAERGRQVRLGDPDAHQSHGRPGGLDPARWDGGDTARFSRRLMGLRRSRLSRRGELARVGRAGLPGPRGHRARRNVEGLQPRLLIVQHADPGRHRGPGLGRTPADLPVTPRQGPMNRDDEPDRAPGRIGPVQSPDESHARGGPVPAEGDQDLHHLGRPRHGREHRPPRARPHRRRAAGPTGIVAVSHAQADARRRAGSSHAPQRRGARVARAQARHPCQPHGGHAVRRGDGRDRIPGRRSGRWPGMHVHHNEQRSLERRPRGRRAVRSGLSGGARLCPAPGSGAPGRRGRLGRAAHRPPSRRQADAARHGGADPRHACAVL